MSLGDDLAALLNAGYRISISRDDASGRVAVEPVDDDGYANEVKRRVAAERELEAVREDLARLAEIEREVAPAGRALRGLIGLLLALEEAPAQMQRNQRFADALRQHLGPFAPATPDVDAIADAVRRTDPSHPFYKASLPADIVKHIKGLEAQSAVE
jgi:hypothetical protein